MTTRRKYTKEFKLEAVRLAGEQGVAKTARDLDINENMIYRWRNRLSTDGEQAFPGNGNPRDEELARTKRENDRLREEVAILKKAVGIFSKPSR